MSAFSPGMPGRCSADDMALPERSRTACVTVAVSTMNRPSRLARCVAAILAGETRPAELIVVDQSSDMRTADLVAAARWNRFVPVTLSLIHI